MLSKLTRSNQITIPKEIIRKIGLKVGEDYVNVEYIDGIICIKPVDIEERIPAERWEKFRKKVVQEEEGDVTLASEEAEDFLVKRARPKTKSS